MNKAAAPLVMSAGQLGSLEVLARSSTAAHRAVQRARVLVLAADGVANAKIAAGVGVTPVTVRAWRDRFAREGLAKFARVRAGRGRKPLISADKIEEIIRLTQHETPAGATHWSCRSMAKRVGVSPATVQRIWSGRGLKPHLLKSFKLSNDPRFEDKLIDVVGLYLNPPEHAVVLCMDEKTSIQALDRTQPSLPLTKGRAGTTTSDYKRHGTITLFAALNALDGTVIGSCMDKHRHEEFGKFLRTIERAVPKTLAVHLILDNYATHKHPAVLAWMAAHPRFQLHFTPTSSSWLNLVERWFRELTDKAIRRGAFHSVPDLISAIEVYMAVHNSAPKPLVWTATAESILTKVRRGRVALDQTVRQ
jgi:transposase/transcriptional regulator with XRE-family HTH domain